VLVTHTTGALFGQYNGIFLKLCLRAEYELAKNKGKTKEKGIGLYGIFSQTSALQF